MIHSFLRRDGAGDGARWWSTSQSGDSILFLIQVSITLSSVAVDLGSTSYSYDN